jgi:hypothetical protein
MLSVNTIKQLLAAQQLQLCSAAGAAAAAAVAALGQGKALSYKQQRSLQTSAEQSEATQVSPQQSQPSTSASSQVQQHWDDEQQAWAPSRALPPPSPYGLKITIKAHDLLFVKMASTAIRDLIMVNVAPKSQDVLPEFWRDRGAGVPWVNLVRPSGLCQLAACVQIFSHS